MTSTLSPATPLDGTEEIQVLLKPGDILAKGAGERLGAPLSDPGVSIVCAAPPGLHPGRGDGREVAERWILSISEERAVGPVAVRTKAGREERLTGSRFAAILSALREGDAVLLEGELLRASAAASRPRRWLEASEIRCFLEAIDKDAESGSITKEKEAELTAALLRRAVLHPDLALPGPKAGSQTLSCELLIERLWCLLSSRAPKRHERSGITVVGATQQLHGLLEGSRAAQVLVPDDRAARVAGLVAIAGSSTTRDEIEGFVEEVLG